MSYVRLPYADAETLHDMSSDCHHAEDNLTLPGQRLVDPTAVDAHPSFASSVAVPDSLARLAGEMELHFD